MVDKKWRLDDFYESCTQRLSHTADNIAAVEDTAGQKS